MKKLLKIILTSIIIGITIKIIIKLTEKQKKDKLKQASDDDFSQDAEAC